MQAKTAKDTIKLSTNASTLNWRKITTLKVSVRLNIARSRKIWRKSVKTIQGIPVNFDANFSGFPDALDIFFVVALSILLLVIYMSSAYDEKLRIRNFRSTKIVAEPEEHYKKEPNVLGMQNENVMTNLNLKTGLHHAAFFFFFYHSAKVSRRIFIPPKLVFAVFSR